MSQNGIGVAALTTLTVMGAMDTPPASGGEWNVREQAGLTLMAGDRCTTCHSESGMAGPVDPMRVSRPRDWVSAHLLDPQMIAPGLRAAPESNQHDIAAILAALARGRSGNAPTLTSNASAVAVLFNRNCLRCHMMGPVGGTEGPKLTAIGAKRDEVAIVRQITTPRAVKSDGEMPSFADKLTTEEIAMLARWLKDKK